MTAPNFFVVGAPKAGTTSLYRYLDQHPSVYMSPIKEPCFFAPEVVDFTPDSRARFETDRPALRVYLDGPMRERRTGIVLEWDQYLKLFKNVTTETAIGEVSGNYLGSSGAPRAIKSRIPDARIVVMLRDPVDRLFSQYAAAVGSGDTRKAFVPWVEEQRAAEAGRRPAFGPVWTGFYASHLARYFEHFARDQVRVFLYEDYSRTPQTVLNDVLAFLQVNERHDVDTHQRHNVTLVPRWPALHRLLAPVRAAFRPIVPRAVAEHARAWLLTPPRRRPTTEERAHVIRVYADDIRRLSSLIDRDLSAWLDPTASPVRQ